MPPLASPLADRMRPRTLIEFIGQHDIIGPGKLLREAITADRLPSMIFWGPPGCGKTSLAHIIAEETKADFIRLSAVDSGVKDLRLSLTRAEQNQRLQKPTILFIDEIHRWNKSQQDGLLPYVERGTITLIGATTENPSFEVRSALLSRCRVFVLHELTSTDIGAIIVSALSDNERGLGALRLQLPDDARQMIAAAANGDARRALNTLEYLADAWQHNQQPITQERVAEAMQKMHLRYDKDGEEHFNIISALHKSMRGSDANAALYWLARMLEAGEDPLYVARRLVRFAAEDIGMANSRALEQAVACYQACHFIGMPECNVILTQCVTYLALSKKSNALYTGYAKAKADVEELGNLPVPLHLRNAPTKLMRELDYGKNYKYSPDFDYAEKQDYLPPELSDRQYLPLP